MVFSRSREYATGVSFPDPQAVAPRSKMSSGEMLLLLPAQRSLDLFPRRLPAGSPRRCLFGRPESSINAIAEEWAEQRERMIHKWDFDIETERPVVPPKRYSWEPLCPGGERVTPATASHFSTKGGKSRRRDRVTPYKQLRITDFWRTKKIDILKKADSEQQQAAGGESALVARAERE